MASRSPAPASVVVIGAGMVGLSTAWFLQEHGVQVTVVEQDHVAAGSSWGNAGWITPGMSTPLPEPSVLRYGLKALFSPASPVYVPPTLNPRLWSFLLRFTRNCTQKRWHKAMGALIGINNAALGAFAHLAARGVSAPIYPAEPFIAAFSDSEGRRDLLAELTQIQHSGGDISFDPISGDEARELEPLLSEEVSSALVIHGQQFINPGQYVSALAASITQRGGVVLSQLSIPSLTDHPSTRTVEVGGTRYDAAVIATGTWLNRLARPFGVRAIVQAGRGYSFSVTPEQTPRAPVYFPQQRIACTPLGAQLRLAGMMEFRPPEAPLDKRRIRAITTAAAPLLRGVNPKKYTDAWVGSRPCTADGLPLIGASRSPRVFIAGGHGMWGITLGPATGQLLAEQIVTGTQPAALRAFNPLR